MRSSRKILVALLALYALDGVISPHIARTASDVLAINLLLGFPAAIALFVWCKLDALERHVSAPAAAPLLVGAIAPVGVPYYFFKTLPLRAALLAIGKAVLFFLVLNLVYVASFQGSAKFAV